MRPTTSHLKPKDLSREWQLADAEGKVLGRLARDIAMVLMGRNRPTFSPQIDDGDGVIVINCEKIQVTGNKAAQKTYVHVTGYPGGRREIPYAEVLEKKPEKILREAVRRMLPKSILGRQMLSKLKLFVGSEHPHTAQQPKPFALYE